MSPLPILGTPCTSAELDARLASLRAMQGEHEMQRRRGNRGLWAFFVAMIVGMGCVFVGSRAFTHAGMGLFAIGGWWCLYRVTKGRWGTGWRWFTLIVFALFLLFLMAIEVVPTPMVLLAALDVRTYPGEALTSVALSLLGVGGALVWDSARAPDRPGALEDALLAYAAELARPLLPDVAIGARGVLRLSPFAPNQGHWIASTQGEMHLRTLDRLVCELTLPLERGEQVLVQVSESVVTRMRHRRNYRGKLKVKAKGYVRSVQARLVWTLRTPAPNAVDLTQHLQGHLHQAGMQPHGMEVRARGTQREIEVRIRRRIRADGGGYPGLEDRWIDVGRVHESARFLAQIRAGLGR